MPITAERVHAGPVTVDRAAAWMECLAAETPARSAPCVQSAEVLLGSLRVRAFAVVQDAANLSARARHGEMGVEQALQLSLAVRELVDSERSATQKTPLLAIVDTPGQALGRHEEAACISAACAASIAAYDTARRCGHLVVTLVVGGAFSGSFLAHGLQADAIFALQAEGVEMQAMRLRSIARITRQSVAKVQEIATRVTPMSYAIQDAARLGIIDALIEGVDADAPTQEQVQRVKQVLAEKIAALKPGARSVAGNPLRVGTNAVVEAMRAQWEAADAVMAGGDAVGMVR
ncbi:biotin-independent malonate decarboxylase subunit gamma [Granulicella cerasi]|uniref:Biotin-independent malonate decarboxylase subunit gamma n=1 Tax=Granulicella cerasi TaxID=741063 RepID=A0ABW1Z814_9BACT|nr:biotin-independent malonate decarboxylase subunit gamma [Granulicella cerasi]